MKKNNAYGAGRLPFVQRHAVSFCLAVSILTFTGDARDETRSRDVCARIFFFYLFYAEKSKLIPALCPRSVYETLSKCLLLRERVSANVVVTRLEKGGLENSTRKIIAPTPTRSNIVSQHVR